MWPDLAGAPLLVVPLGSVEQHGHHLPLSTDTTVACAVAESAAHRLDGALLAPALAYGASGEHEGFPGTISLGTEALTGLLVEYGRSASRWAGRVLVVNGHGGNLDALAAAGGVLTAQYNPQIDPLMGIITGLKAFVAAVLGGIGNIPGAVLGGLLIGAAETFVVGYGQYVGIPSTFRDAVAFSILILVLLFRPSGLLGSTVQEKV